MTVLLAHQPIDADLLLPVVPTDREVVTALHRLAAAQAHLMTAEQAADAVARGPADPPRRIPEVEEARASLLWCQADLLTFPRAGRRRRVAAAAAIRLADLLTGHGFSSFDDYIATRQRQETRADPGLELARREYDGALQAWSALQAEFGERTVVLDLTGDQPRRLA